jgi:hypothetical protein
MSRYIGMDVHRDFAQIAMVQDGIVRDNGKIGVTPERCGLGLRPCVTTTKWPRRSLRAHHTPR